MNVTSLWEFNCYYFPELALKEYKDCLTSGELGKFLANESLRKLARVTK